MVVMEKKMQLPSAPQLAKIAALVVLFLLAPLVPSSLRQPCLYLLFNALVITLVVEAGFLDAISGPRDDKKPPTRTVSPKQQGKQPSVNPAAVSNARLVRSTAGPLTNTPTTTCWTNKLLADDMAAKQGAGVALDMASTMVKKKKIKKCPSRPSIFFIASVEDDWEDANVTVHEEDEGHGKKGEAGDLMSKQELFTNAEAFIGNFYNQLKMQREESWKRLQDLYSHHHRYKAF